MLDFKSIVSDFYTKLTPQLFYSYLFFVAAYAALVLLPGPQPAILQRYHVSVTGLRLIYLSIIIILAIIWFTAFYGYTKLYRYSKLIRKDKDGKQLYILTRGVCLLALWLPVSSTVSALLDYISSKHAGLLSATTIVSNYISLLMPLIGFILIGRGAHGLRKLIRKRIIYNYNLSLILIALLAYISIVYMHLIVSSPQRDFIYHLSFWLISLTIVAPYVFMWTVGLLAVVAIYHYMQNVEGVVYKQSLRNLAFGIGWLVLTTIVFQYLSTLTPKLINLSVYIVLAIIYSLLLLLSVGFVFIALGAKKLQRLEEL